MPLSLSLGTDISLSLCVVSPHAGDFKTAAYYCKLSSEAVQAALGGTSIELGHELHKLAQLYFNR